jgi:hypothetical protein
MSYNIDTFKLKGVRLTLPKEFTMAGFFGKAWDRPWDKIYVSTDLKTWEYNWGNEGFQMKGKVTDDGLEVTDLVCVGMGSGTEWNKLVEPLFKALQGDLEASLVWEGGDSITRNIIKKGVATEEEIAI